MFGMKIKKVNQSRLEENKEKLRLVKMESKKAEKTLDDLRHLYGEDNWKDYDNSFRKINLEEMEQIISTTEMECKKNVFRQKEATRLIQSLEDEMNQALILFGSIDQLPVTILKAQANVYDLLDSINNVYTEMESTMLRIQTSSNKIRKMYENAKDNFNQTKKAFDLLKSGEVDWIKFSNLFIKSHNLMRMARDGVKTAEEFMNRKQAMRQS